MISSSSARASLQIGEHEFLGQRCHRGRRRRAPRSASRAVRSRVDVSHVRDAGQIAQTIRCRPARQRSPRSTRRARRPSAPILDTRSRSRRRATRPGDRDLFATTTRAAALARRRTRAIVVVSGSSRRAPRRSGPRRCARLRARDDPFGFDRVARRPQARGIDQRHAQPSMSTVSVTRSRVVPGTSVTMARADAGQAR